MTTVQSSHATIDVVMVAYNRKPMVFHTLPQLLASNRIGQVIVVDNHSSDHLTSEGTQLFPQVKWIYLNQNIGCVAWNIGIKHTCSQFAIILDDDCIPELSSLDSVIDTFLHNNQLGMAVFNIVNRFSLKSEWGRLEMLDGRDGWANAIGACTAVRVEAFLKIGGYKDFFLCFNDTDLALSMWEAGYSVIYNRNWRAFHHKKPERWVNRRFFFEVRNLLCTIWTHLPVDTAMIIGVKYIAGALIDAKAYQTYWTILDAGIRGFCKGLIHRRKRIGTAPAHVLRNFYHNFMVSDRLPLFGQRLLKTSLFQKYLAER